MTNKNIPNTLKIHRKKAKLTQEQVALKLGFTSKDRICKWEKGKTYPHVVNLFKLADLYMVLPNELYPNLSKFSIDLMDEN